MANGKGGFAKEHVMGCWSLLLFLCDSCPSSVSLVRLVYLVATTYWASHDFSTEYRTELSIFVFLFLQRILSLDSSSQDHL